MKNFCILISAIFFSTPGLLHAALSFSGTSLPAVEIKPENSSGIDMVYVLESTSGVTISYEASGSRLNWYSFSSLGGAYAQPVENVSQSGRVYSISASSADLGYIIEDGDRRYYYWVVNYRNHQLDMQSVRVDAERSDCQRVTLAVDGKAAPITFYSINGRAIELSRQLKLSYYTLQFDRDALQWKTLPVTQEISGTSAVGALSVDAPLCNTTFELSGDRFLVSWNREQVVETDFYNTTAVSAYATASQLSRDNDNEKKPETSGLGGSAPCEITFTAVPTDAAVFHEWQFSRTETFDDILDRFQENEFTQVFDEKGTIYARYQCGDSNGQCFYESEVFTISVGESRLEIPNAFSPANQDGVNDIWKVSYQSLVSFQCKIFNRWGTEIISFDNPASGWDGKYKGKFVPSGVYFYVIKARGADGVEYNKAGDINIINSRRTGTSGDSTP